MRSHIPEQMWPVQQPSEKDLVCAQLLASLKDYVEGPLELPTKGDRQRGGTRTKEAQQAIETIAAAVHSEDVVKGRRVSTGLDLTGLTRAMWNKGGELRQRNSERGDVSLGGERATRKDCVDLDWVYNWFHESSPDVEPDKTVKWNYKRKKILCAGKTRMIECRPRVLTCSRTEAAHNFMKSDVYLRSGVTLHHANVMSCICHCTKAAKREECSCPICTEFTEALTAYHRNRGAWHDDEHATCDGSCGLECRNPESEFRTFTRNYSIFESHLRCAKRAYDAAKLPHEEQAPEFYQLRCCLKRRRNNAGAPTGHHEPRDVQPCERCASKRARLLQAPGEKQCPDEHNDTSVTWRKYKDVELEDGKTANKLVEHEGTRRELLTQIEKTAQEWSFHRCLFGVAPRRRHRHHHPPPLPDSSRTGRSSNRG